MGVTDAAPARAAALVLDAARRTGPPDGDGDGHAGPHAWRDAAVRLALAEAWERGDGAGVRALASGYDALLLRVPERRRGGLVLAPAGAGERRRRGAFSTPPDLAATLARRGLPGPFDGVPAVVDPACGAGALLRAALDRLLDLGLPAREAAVALHGVDADAVAVRLCRTVLAVELTGAGHPCEPDDLAGRVLAADALVGPGACPGDCPDPPGGDDDADAVRDGALVWHRAFPAVLDRPGRPPEPVTGWRGGFDAVLANPPWERLKVHARDWAGGPPAALRARHAAAARGVRDGGRHPLTGTGELNAYLPFVETCWRLLAPDGRAAVLVPAGVASDRSAAGLLAALVEHGALRRLHVIEPAAPIFTGVSSRVGVALVELHGGPTGPARGDPAEVAVGVPGADVHEDRDDVDGRAWSLDAELLRLVNPNTGTAPLFGSAADARTVAALHRRAPVLVRRDPASTRVLDDAWSLRLVTPLHMTRDARSFRTAPGEGLVPLRESMHVGLLDPHGVSRPDPRYWVPAALMPDRYPELCRRGWLAGYRNVATAASPRTLVVAPLPVTAVGNSLPLVHAPRLPLLLAALASLPVDYVIRQKHAGANLNFFKLEQLPVPPPDVYDAPAPWDPATTPARWLAARLARAIAWAPGLEPLAAELGLATLPDRPAEPDRRRALAEIDAAHAVLLGLCRAELARVAGTFTALRRRELAVHGRPLTEELVLAAYDALTG